MGNHLMIGTTMRYDGNANLTENITVVHMHTISITSFDNLL